MLDSFDLRNAMRGEDQRSEVFFSYVRLDTRIPADHPLRAIRALIDEALTGLSRDFNKLYARAGRPSIPPERLLRALLLQAFYTVRSERQLMEQLDYNLLFRWFVGLSADDPVWDATVFCKNRDRLLNGDIARKFNVPVRCSRIGTHLVGCVDKTLRCRALHPRQAHIEASRQAEGAPFGTEIDLGVDRMIGRQRDLHVARDELHRRPEARGPTGREELLRVGAGAGAAGPRQHALEAAVGAPRHAGAPACGVSLRGV